MTAKKIIIAAAILLSASSAALAQSAWTTGTAENRADEGYTTPSVGGIYAYAPDSNGLSSYAAVPHPQGQFIDIPALSGGGSRDYNELVRPVW
jgi:hypothetical protein